MAMRTIKGQVLASTGPVKKGASIPAESIRELFKQTPPETFLYPDHDSSLPPVGKCYNKRLEEKEDGHLAIVADVDLDEDLDLENYKGFSIGFLGPKGFAPTPNPSATICLDTRYFDDGDLRFAAGKTSAGDSVGSRQLFRYSLGETIVTILIMFPLIQVAQGFFTQIGNKLASLVLDKLHKLAKAQEEKDISANFDFSFPVEDGDYTYTVSIRASPNHLKIIELGLVSLDDLRTEIRSIMDASKIEKVHAELSVDSPYLRNIRCTPRAGGAPGAEPQ